MPNFIVGERENETLSEISTESMCRVEMKKAPQDQLSSWEVMGVDGGFMKGGWMWGERERERREKEKGKNGGRK